ncbi:MAG TPA: OmpA family protein [Gemmatimonadota bacterium]|nr:OmpA family protein [Gemmatimonadota bacterium]
MSSRRVVAALSCAVLFGLLGANASEAQIWNRVKEAAGEAVEDETARAVEDLVRNGVRCVFDDLECIRAAEESGDPVVLTDDEGNLITDEDGAPVTDPEAAAERAEAKPGEGAWANYDFVPGDRILFYDDFSDDNVGDFPRRLEFVRGNWDIIEWEDRLLLRNTGPRTSAFKIVLPEELPEQFTIEFDIHMPHTNQRIAVSTAVPEQGMSNLALNSFQVGRNGTGVKAGGESEVEALNRSEGTIEARMTPIRIMVDGRYAKVYVNERRVANVPNAQLARGDVVYFENVYVADEENPILLGAVRVAAGGKDMYDVLEAEGRVTTRGILFGINSDRIRPESTPVLKEIGEMLEDHPELRISINGHTDSDGDDAYNQELSERRAAAVKDFLVESYGIDAGRLETAGLGESQPVADNSTPEGKQQNRRVELVKID